MKGIAAARGFPRRAQRLHSGIPVPILLAYAVTSASPCGASSSQHHRSHLRSFAETGAAFASPPLAGSLMNRMQTLLRSDARSPRTHTWLAPRQRGA
jgi:hypothetical protein